MKKITGILLIAFSIIILGIYVITDFLNENVFNKVLIASIPFIMLLGYKQLKKDEKIK